MKTQEQMMNKWLRRIACTSLLVALYGAGSCLPGTGSWLIYNILRERVKSWAKTTHITESPLLKKLNISHEEFCKIVDTYQGPIDCFQLNRYVEKQVETNQ